MRTVIRMTQVYEVRLVGYTPEDWYVDETVGMFETIEQAQRIANELLEMWPEDREGLVPQVTCHDLGRIEDTNVAIALSEQALDKLICESGDGRPIDTERVDEVISDHTLDGPIAEELRRAYAPFARSACD